MSTRKDSLAHVVVYRCLPHGCVKHFVVFNFPFPSKLSWNGAATAAMWTTCVNWSTKLVVLALHPLLHAFVVVYVIE